jgi:glucoamylase
MLTGNAAELGNWSTTWNGAIGPVMIPSTGSGLLTVSVPAGTIVQFKFLVLHSDGSVTWESGVNHSYVVPGVGVGAVAVNWQD